jgi:ATP-dependent Lon protease
MADLESKKAYPALALRGLVPLPHNELRTEVGRKNSVKALEESEQN